MTGSIITDIDYDITADIGFDLRNLPRRYVHFDAMGKEVSYQVEPNKIPTITIWSDGFCETTLIYHAVFRDGRFKIVRPPYGSEWTLVTLDRNSSRWRRTARQ